MFALDTACAQTLVRPEVVDSLGYSARDGETTATVTSALGQERGYLLRVARIFALGHELVDFRVNVHDLPDDPGLAGLLGLNFLRHFNYEVRSQEGRLFVAPV